MEVAMADAQVREIPISFHAFLISLAQSALVNLGEIADPATGRAERNVALARQTVGLLEVLAEKTKGNLDAEEQKLLDSLIADLSKRVAA
jgi:hypothetical protein